MLRRTCLLIAVLTLVASRAANAQDAGAATMDAAVQPALPPYTPHFDDPIWDCMSDCMAVHGTCIDASIIYRCYGEIPACRHITQQASAQTQVIQRFCDMCASRLSPANNCPGSPSVSAPATFPTVPMFPASSPQGPNATTSPTATAVASPEQSSGAPATTTPRPRRERPRPLPPDVCRDHRPPLPYNSSECLCIRENGTWVRDYPYTDGDGHIQQSDTCLTNAFAALETRVGHLDRRVTNLEQRPQGVSEDRAHEIANDAVAQETRDRQAAVNRLDREIVDTHQMVGAISRRVDHIESHHLGRTTNGRTIFGFRIGPFLGAATHQIPNGSGGSVYPFFAGLELSWMPAITPILSAELGYGFGYAGPMTYGNHHLESVLHTGFVLGSGIFSAGFGIQFMERLTLQLQGLMYSIGPYIEVMLATASRGPAFFVSLRVVPSIDVIPTQANNPQADFSLVGTLHVGFQYR